MKMKVAAPPKKVKSALSKVSMKKVTKKQGKDGLGKNTGAILKLAAESLSTPEKKIITKSLKKKKPIVASPVASVSPKKPIKTLKSSVAKSPVLAKSTGIKEISAESPKVLTKSLKMKRKKKLSVSESSEANTESRVDSLVTKLPKMKKQKKSKSSEAKTENSADSPVVTKAPKMKKLMKNVASESSELKAESSADSPVATESLVTQYFKSLFPNRTGTKKRSHRSGTTSTSKSLQPDLVDGVCTGALKLINASQEGQEKKDLFGSSGQPVYLQATLFRVPEAPSRVFKIPVPNSVHSMEPEVLLVVPDIKRGRFRDVTFAKFLQQYEEKFFEAGIKGINQILPFSQLRAEYSQFELQRRLLNSFDIILCDVRIINHCTKFLSAMLQKCNKSVTCISVLKREEPKPAGMPPVIPKPQIRDFIIAPDFQQKLDKACRSVTLKVHGRGTSYSMNIGHSQFTGKQLAENVHAVWMAFNKCLPGGVENIKTAYLKGGKTLPVPLYASLTPLEKVPSMVPKEVLPAVEDELSTTPGFSVVVDAFGNVDLKSKQSSDDLKFLKNVLELDDTKGSKRSNKSQAAPKRKRTKKNDDAMNDLSDSDEDLLDMMNTAAAEETYMKQWAADQEKQGDEDESKPEKKKRNKKGSQKLTSDLGQKKPVSKKITVQTGKQPAKKRAAKKMKKAPVSKSKA